MSRKSFEIENSLNIRPKATADLDANSQGDIDVDSTINRPVYNDGSSNLAMLVAGDAPPPGTYITSLTGDVTAVGPGAASATIASNAVSNAKLADMPASTIKGNNTGGVADPADLTVTQVQTLLAVPTTDSPLPLNRGGTGVSAASANAAFNELSPMTTAGDVIVGGVSGAGTRLPIGSTSQVLTVIAGTPAWQTPTAATITANRAAVSDGSGAIIGSATTATEVGYLSGVTAPTGTGALVLGSSPSLTTPAITSPLMSGNPEISTTSSTVLIANTTQATGLVEMRNSGSASMQLRWGTASSIITDGAGNGRFWVYSDPTTSGQVAQINGDSASGLLVRNSAAAASAAKRVISSQYITDTDCTGGYFLTCLNSASTAIGRIEAATNTTVSYQTSSDCRMKEAPSDFSGLALIKQLQPKQYQWKKGNGRREHGFYAQEIHQIIPEVVSVGEDELTESGDLATPWAVDYGRITPILTKAIQELSEQVAQLKAELDLLKAK